MEYYNEIGQSVGVVGYAYDNVFLTSNLSVPHFVDSINVWTFQNKKWKPFNDYCYFLHWALFLNIGISHTGFAVVLLVVV